MLFPAFIKNRPKNKKQGNAESALLHNNWKLKPDNDFFCALTSFLYYSETNQNWKDYYNICFWIEISEYRTHWIKQGG